MRVLDLFSGLGGFSKPFADRGHEVTTLDMNPSFWPDIKANLMRLAVDDPRVQGFDVILASPPCETFSVARIAKNWVSPGVPRSDAARSAIELVRHTLAMIDRAAPRFWVMENPNGMLKTVIGPPIAVITLCQYGAKWQKPTCLWGRFPPGAIRPRCSPGASCHEAAPRGSGSGVQGVRDPAERARMPYGLGEALCITMEADSLVPIVSGLPDTGTDGPGINHEKTYR